MYSQNGVNKKLIQLQNRQTVFMFIEFNLGRNEIVCYEKEIKSIFP